MIDIIPEIINLVVVSIVNTEWEDFPNILETPAIWFFIFSLINMISLIDHPIIHKSRMHNVSA